MAGDGWIVQGQKEVQNLSLAFVEPMALKCALELRVPDIIHSNGSPMSVSQIAAKIGSPSLSILNLSRIMRFLVHKNIFISTTSHDDVGDILYDLTPSSRLLLQDSEMTCVPAVFMVTDPLLMNPWQQLSGAIMDGENVIEKVYGSSLWELASKNPKFNNLFNSSMEGLAKFTTMVILSAYEGGFGDNIESLVDVGGGKGYLLSEIVKANWPRIKGINFDLPHVVEGAPEYAGVTHVGGDMFEFVPEADAIIMKAVLHNWGDEECKKILRNCRKALSKKTGKLINQKTGKLILVNAIVEPGGRGLLDDTILKLDLLMMIYCVGGRERTQAELFNLLEETGFSQFKIIRTPTLHSIIEAYAS